jgi:hypothetical protein
MSDFSPYTAGQIADWMSQGTVASPPTNLYVAVFDDTDTERSGDFQNDRVSTTTGTDWTIVNTGFESGVQVDFGGATVDVNNLQDIALFDDTLANGGNEIARYPMTDAPFSVTAGTNLLFSAGNITFDVLDNTEA